MKTLVATLLLLFAVLLLSVLNLFYVRHVGDEMTRLIESLPPIDDEACLAHTQRINTYWKEQEGILEMSIPYPLIDRVCEQASLLGACAKAGDRDGFLHARTLLSDALEDVARAEELSPSNLF